MSYYHYEVTDFLEDNDFRAWIYDPAPEKDLYWKDFLIRYPEKSEMISNAKSILLELKKDSENQFPTDQKVEDLLFNINSVKNKKRFFSIEIFSSSTALSIASAAMLILLLGWLIKPADNDKSITYEELISSAESPLNEKTNNSSKPLSFTLPDSSTVVLQPMSCISYCEDFEKNNKREIYLSGEAFFDVTKNPDRPFFVYSNELITKVLGTSFIVKAFDCEKQVEVEVKTGKVSVFTRNDPDAKLNQSNAELGGTIITPNQKVLFSREEIRIKKSLVESPEIIASSVLPAPMLKFQDKNVSQIFANLEQTYGIDIVYDEELFGSCLLTASFTNENLYDKIDLICKGIEANFEIVDARVVISGRGCHQE
ncbi:FecR family protein [Dyadobacter sp. CY345]|uniref:FecR family protein n=1 Tax=Dyadobacter sp. CY345 TaxID=2909335 RepID=UPI001F17B4F7|nr:FecR family protein [Dyadobacter sp. CY345]MCF2443008.1 FecR family protein [Dyadobacter sp. CY345]